MILVDLHTCMCLQFRKGWKLQANCEVICSSERDRKTILMIFFKRKTMIQTFLIHFMENRLHWWVVLHVLNNFMYTNLIFASKNLCESTLFFYFAKIFRCLFIRVHKLTQSKMWSWFLRYKRYLKAVMKLKLSFMSISRQKLVTLCMYKHACSLLAFTANLTFFSYC